MSLYHITKVGLLTAKRGLGSALPALDLDTLPNLILTADGVECPRACGAELTLHAAVVWRAGVADDE